MHRPSAFNFLVIVAAHYTPTCRLVLIGLADRVIRNARKYHLWLHERHLGQRER